MNGQGPRADRPPGPQRAAAPCWCAGRNADTLRHPSPPPLPCSPVNQIIATIAGALAAATLLGSAGCREPVRTLHSVAGEYVVVERDGQPLPHTLPLEVDGQRCASTLIRLVMTLREDGTWNDEVEERRQCPGAPPRTLLHRVPDSDTFQLRGPRGDTLMLGTHEVEGYPRAWGVFKGDELRLVLTHPYHRDTTYYRYVRQRRRD